MHARDWLSEYTLGDVSCFLHLIEKELIDCMIFCYFLWRLPFFSLLNGLRPGPSLFNTNMLGNIS
jgi:hypothetical protein